MTADTSNLASRLSELRRRLTDGDGDGCSLKELAEWHAKGTRQKVWALAQCCAVETGWDPPENPNALANTLINEQQLAKREEELRLEAVIQMQKNYR